MLIKALPGKTAQLDGEKCLMSLKKEAKFNGQSKKRCHITPKT